MIKLVPNIANKFIMLNTVIFDMDGLLIDSEPLWQEATNEILAIKGLKITPQQYASSTGLRTAEFLEYWLRYFKLDMQLKKSWEELLFEKVIDKVKEKGQVMMGVKYILDFFKQRNFKIGLASSSPMSLINTVVEMLQAKEYFGAIESAQNLPFGKPNPQVYINCANTLNSHPRNCICFEDSFNGLLAAKSALMKCVIVPTAVQAKDNKWVIADLQLSSLQNFGELHLMKLMQ